MGFPTKNDHFGVWNGGTTILGNHPYNTGNNQKKQLCGVLSSFFFQWKTHIFVKKTTKVSELVDVFYPDCGSALRKSGGERSGCSYQRWGFPMRWVGWLWIYRFLIPRFYGILFKGAMKGQVWKKVGLCHSSCWMVICGVWKFVQM